METVLTDISEGENTGAGNRDFFAVKKKANKATLIRAPELVKVKGGSKSQKPLVTLTKEEFQLLVMELREPIRTMAIVCMCIGLRISEVLAFRWESLDFNAGTMMVERAVVNG